MDKSLMGMHVVMCWPDTASEEHPNAAPYVMGPFKTGYAARIWANARHAEQGELSAFVPMKLFAP